MPLSPDKIMPNINKANNSKSPKMALTKTGLIVEQTDVTGGNRDVKEEKKD